VAVGSCTKSRPAGLHGPWRAPADRTAGAAGKRFAGGSRGGYMRAVW
jgi:hypothetical protein